MDEKAPKSNEERKHQLSKYKLKSKFDQYNKIRDMHCKTGKANVYHYGKAHLK